jgi:hypothetical protein
MELILLEVALTLSELIKAVSDLGVIGILVAVIFGGYRGWWVFGWQFKDLKQREKAATKERDDWRDLALRGTNIAQETVRIFRDNPPSG